MNIADLILLVGLASYWFAVASAVNMCLDPTTSIYECRSTPSTIIDLSNCGLHDRDVQGGDLAACLDDFGRETITHLSLDFNALTTLPEDIFYGMTALTNLDLSANNLTTLPEGVFAGLTSLSSIAIDDNDLIILPERFSVS